MKKEIEKKRLKKELKSLYTAIFESPPEKDLYNLLISTNFVKTHKEHVKIIPQFKIGEYIKAEYAKQIPKYRVDFLMTF